MDWPEVFNYCWQWIVGLSNTCTLLVGFWIPATVAILTIDMNAVYQVICLLVIYIVSSIIVIHVLQILGNIYIEIIKAITVDGTPYQTKIVALISIMIFTLLCYLVIIPCVRFYTILPGVVLNTGGNKDASRSFFNAITSENQRAIGYRA
jgi:hypothetical protein